MLSLWLHIVQIAPVGYHPSMEKSALNQQRKITRSLPLSLPSDRINIVVVHYSLPVGYSLLDSGRGDYHEELVGDHCHTSLQSVLRYVDLGSGDAVVEASSRCHGEVKLRSWAVEDTGGLVEDGHKCLDVGYLRTVVVS